MVYILGGLSRCFNESTPKWLHQCSTFLLRHLVIIHLVTLVANKHENGIPSFDPSHRLVENLKTGKCSSRGDRVHKDEALAFARESGMHIRVKNLLGDETATDRIHWSRKVAYSSVAHRWEGDSRNKEWTYPGQQYQWLLQNTFGHLPPTAFSKHPRSSGHMSNRQNVRLGHAWQVRRAYTSEERSQGGVTIEIGRDYHRKINWPTKQFKVNWCGVGIIEGDLGSKWGCTCTASAVLPTPPSPSTATLQLSISNFL